MRNVFYFNYVTEKESTLDFIKHNVQLVDIDKDNSVR